MKKTTTPASPALRARPSTESPLQPLESENRALVEAAAQLRLLLEIPVWKNEEVITADELVRGLRIKLPAHCLKVEHILLPELKEQGLLPADAAADLRRRHLTVEDDFAEVQAIALAISMGESTRGLRRKVLRAVRKFQADLDELVAVEQAAALDPGASRLPAASLARVRSHLDAAELRALLKRLDSG